MLKIKYPQLFAVTRYSKYSAMLLMLILPILGAWQGFEWGYAKKAHEVAMESQQTHQQFERKPDLQFDFKWDDTVWPNIPPESERGRYEEMIKDYIALLDPEYYSENQKLVEVIFFNFNNPDTNSTDYHPDVLIKQPTTICPSWGCLYDLVIDLDYRHTELYREAYTPTIRYRFDLYYWERILAEFSVEHGTRIFETAIDDSGDRTDGCVTNSIANPPLRITDHRLKAWNNRGEFVTTRNFTCEETLERLGY